MTLLGKTGFCMLVAFLPQGSSASLNCLQQPAFTPVPSFFSVLVPVTLYRCWAFLQITLLTLTHSKKLSNQMLSRFSEIVLSDEDVESDETRLLAPCICSLMFVMPM